VVEATGLMRKKHKNIHDRITWKNLDRGSVGLRNFFKNDFLVKSIPYLSKLAIQKNINLFSIVRDVDL
jgi:hypothetical protein